MTLNQRLTEALSGLGVPVVPNVYTGAESQYITFNYDEVPIQFAGNRPIYAKALIQVHLFCTLTYNSLAQRRKVVEAITDAGFTWPEVIDATDQETQHFIFETETILNYLEE